MVRGSVRPLRLNCELVELTDEMVTLAPLAVIVPLRLSVLPISTAPNEIEAGDSAICPKLVPLPDSETVTEGSDAFDVTASVPLMVPVAVGVNATASVKLWPGAKATGSAIAPKANPLPVTPAWEIETGDPPEFVRVTDSVWLLPTSVFPKFKPATLGVRYPEVVATPESWIVVVFVFARPLLPDVDAATTAKAPLAVPAVWGANVTSRFALCRGARLKGRTGPPKLNPLPLTVAPVTVRVFLPLLLTLAANVLLLPICMLPKLRVEEVTAIWLNDGRAEKSSPASGKIQARKYCRETRSLIRGSLSPCYKPHGGG